MANPKLSILIATQGRRNDMFGVLLKNIMKQTKKHGDKIEVLAYWNNAELKIGDIRQSLLEEAKGDYVCFVDDDDLVPDYYCDEIIKALGKDYVGFQVELWMNAEKQKPVYHSLRYRKWGEDSNGHYRNVTHLNPIKRSLALHVGYERKAHFGEDSYWARDTLPVVKTENYIDKVMYIYKHNELSSFKNAFVIEKSYKRKEYKYKNFRYHPDSKKEWSISENFN